jgi:hypothetical protein
MKSLLDALERQVQPKQLDAHRSTAYPSTTREPPLFNYGRDILRVIPHHLAIRSVRA